MKLNTGAKEIQQVNQGKVRVSGIEVHIISVLEIKRYTAYVHTVYWIVGIVI